MKQSLHKPLNFLVATLTAIFTISTHADQSYTIYVAPKGSTAYENAKILEDKGLGITARTLTRAFKSARKTFDECGSCRVNIRVAGGSYYGKAKTGMWFFPDVKAPQSSLRILGGYNEEFTERDPFSFPTVLKSNENRAAPVLNFEGKKHALGELVISGLVMDVSPSNAYDPNSNSLMRSGSSTWGMLSLGYLTTDRLVIADNTFMNATHGVAQPMIRPMTEQAEVVIRNNLMINNIMNWRVEPGSYGKMVKNYRFENNSFILNWPYNPDTTTSLVGGVIIGNQYSAETVSFEKNLFAYNVGGAIMPNFVEGPQIIVNDNLFYANGLLFPSDGNDDGAVVGKFNRAATYASLTMEDIEDDFDWEASDNQSFDPELPITVLKLKGLNQEPTDKQMEESASANAASENTSQTADNDFNIDDLIGEEEFELEENFRADEWADENGIKNFAPQFPYHPAYLPFPQNPDAITYGASSDNVEVYDE